MRYFLLMTCLLMLFACQNSRRDGPASDVTVEEATLKKQFLPVIKGNWIPTDYIAELKITRSPYKAYENLQGISALVIDDSAVAGDSIVAHVNFNNHEDGTLPIYFKPGKGRNSLATGYKYFVDPSHTYELGYTLTPADTLLVINHYDKEGKLISFKNFSRIGATTTPQNTGWGIEHVVNKTLIAGSYIIEGTKPAVKVTFTVDGKVTGFDGLESYIVGTDFASNDPDELPPADYIYFKNGGISESTSYTFKVTGNTLLLSGNNEHYLLVKQ
jgi:hypothetical protein